MVAMVILNYNDCMTVLNYLKLIKNYNNIDKIIVVDNCSTDESWNSFLEVNLDKVDFIRSEFNGGYSAGNNVGIRYLLKNYTEVDKIIISNPDIYISEKDLNKILESINNEYVMATGLVYNSDLEGKKITLASNWGWKVPVYKDMICNCFLSTYKISRSILKKGIYYNYEKYKHENQIDVEAVPGCFFVIDRKFLERIGLFEERTFLFGEENILGFQIKEKHRKVCVVNNTKILHKQSTSINKSIKKDWIKNKFLLKSYDIYLKDYLKCNTLLINIFHILFYLGIFEKKILSILLKLKKEWIVKHV